MRILFRLSLLLVACLLAAPSFVRAQEHTLHTFERQQLSNVYFSEGANAGDINGDGKPDIVYGPYWYEGPDFKTKHEIYPAKPQNREGYANNFFNWVYDFNGDGRNDILVVGFPGTPAYVYENPGPGNYDKPWKKHKVLNSVSNESPQFVNLIGDAQPELVCTSNGQFGFATFEPKKGFEPWTFHSISVMAAPKPFGHGLGIGDINGDGLQDIVICDRLVRATQEERGHGAMGISPRFLYPSIRRRRDVRLRRGRRWTQRCHHQPRCSRFRPRLV